MIHQWKARRIHYTNNLLKDFEAAVLQRESVATVYSRLIALSSLVNPGLNIEGQGSIEFPVLMQNLVPPPINRSEPEDNRQWELESKYVRFDNPSWEQFLRHVMGKCDTKESSVQEHSIGLEFRKLVLFDSGSSYLPQSCYADDDDNASILLVILPSMSPSKAAEAGIDYSATSMPFGYVLALYYKLTFPSNANFTNTLYTEDNLRRVLVRWNKGEYPCENEDYFSAPYLFYRLPCNYDLGNGKPVLSDEDQKLALLIHHVADELDFILCLGQYYRSVDPMFWPNRSISDVMDMDGDHVIGNQSLWPSNGYIGESAERIGDQPIGEAVHDKPLSCTVMILFRAKAMYDIAFFNRTDQEMLQELVSISDRPAKKVQRMAMYIIKFFKGGRSNSGVGALASMIEFTLPRLDIELWKEAVNASLPYTDHGLLWEHRDVLLQSMQVFGFEKVRSSFERILDTAPFDTLYAFLREIPFNLAIDDDANAINLWCDERLRLGLRSFGVDKYVNVPHLIDMAHNYGIHYLLEIRHSGHSDKPFLFADKLIRTLQRKKIDILASKANIHFDTVSATAILEGQGYKLRVLSSEHAIDIIVDRWLSEAIDNLPARSKEKKGYFDHHSHLIGEYYDVPWPKTHELVIMESLGFVKLCIIAGHVQRCGIILDAIEELDGNERTKLQFYTVPLVCRLGPLLQAMHIDISSPPFAPFFRRIIECYIRCFLGTRTRNPQEMFLRQKINSRFHCICKTCTEVKEFLHQLYIPRRYLSGSDAALFHIECNTTILYELADIRVVDPPMISLQITKKQDVFGIQRWENRLKNMRGLLRCIGSEPIIERVMGDKYFDLKVAMEGKGEIWDEMPMEENETRGGRAERRRRNRIHDGGPRRSERIARNTRR